MRAHPPGRTTRDGNLELARKPDAPAARAGARGGAAAAGVPHGGAGSHGSGGVHGGGRRDHAPPPQLEPMATAALICGILSIAMICCCGLFTMLLGPLAILLGVLSIVRIRGNPALYTGEGMAWAGIGTGAAGLVFWVLYFVFAFGVQFLSVLAEM
jgi:hypothetical protein